MIRNKSSLKKRPRGRPKLLKSKTRLECQCGGASGKGVCEKGIVYDQCNQCKRACKAGGKCAEIFPPKKFAQTRIRTGVAVHQPNMYVDPEYDVTEAKYQW